jgi:hypothetical protein
MPVVLVVLLGSMIAHATSRFITKKGTKLLAEILELSVQLDASRQLPDNYIFYPEFIDIIPADKHNEFKPQLSRLLTELSRRLY